MRNSIRSSDIGVVIITALGFGLRLYHLDKLGLWMDEGFTAMMVQEASLSKWITDVHPPLYHALLLVWSKLSGSDFWLRCFSALLGCATIPVGYAIGRSFFSIRVGLWSAMILAVLPIHLWYSQEARKYSLMPISA